MPLLSLDEREDQIIYKSNRMFFKKILIGSVVASVVGFGYYAISPLFRHIQVDEPVPVSTIQKTESQPAQTVIAEVRGTAGHPASGNARIVEADGKAYVRYENLKTINGPDIYVYLSKDLEAKEYVSLGKVKATEGNVNYEIPVGTTISDYPYVLTWCQQFGVLFNSAQVN